MTGEALRPPGESRTVISLALVCGLLSGLVEGAGHLALQRLAPPDNVWYDILWIAPIVNGLLVGAVGVFCAVVLGARLTRPRWRALAIFAIVLASAAPCLALLLKEWVEPYAIVLLLIGAAAAMTRALDAHWPRTGRRAVRLLAPLAAGTVLLAIALPAGAWVRERRAVAALPSAATDAPHVLIVVIDTLRSDHLSSYGYTRQTSPVIDRLAREGTLFERAFSASSYTLPSHASILTGLYPEEHGVEWDASFSRRAAFPTLPERLQQAGYRTGAFSGNTNYFTREYGFGRGFHHFEDFFHSALDRVLRTAYGRIAAKAILPRLGFQDDPSRKRATDTNEAVFRWLDREQQRPAFVFVNYMDVHDPYLPPQPFAERFNAGRPPQGLLRQNTGRTRLSDEELADEIAAYDAGIAYTDEQLGALARGMQARSNGRELLVLVTSDHGEEFVEHGLFLHGNHLYREVLQVPLIVWQPGRVPAGRRIGQPVSNTAIPATVLEALGLDRSLPGDPLQPLWSATAADGRWPAPLAALKQRAWASAREPVHHGSMRSAVSGRLHYIETSNGERHLFDVVSDPDERHDRAADADAQADLTRMRDLLASPRRAPGP